VAYRVTFCLDGFTWADRARAKRRLQILLDALTALCREWFEAHPEAPNVWASGMRYIREPLGEEDWQEPGYSLRKGGGDCEDLACYQAGWEQAHGIPSRAVARAKPWRLPNGGWGILFHIVVVRPDGQVLDPSKDLGMKGSA